MKLTTTKAAACLFLVLLIAAGLEQSRDKLVTTEVNETFMRGGALGDLLRDAGLVGISNSSHDLAIGDSCADKEALKGFDFHDQLRLRIKLTTPQAATLTVRVKVGEKGHDKTTIHSLDLNPEVLFYHLPFAANKNEDIRITYELPPHAEATLWDVFIDGRYHRSAHIMSGGQPINSDFTYLNSKPYVTTSETSGARLQGAEPSLDHFVSEGLDEKFYRGVFPGKKNKGHCTYVAMPYQAQAGRSLLPSTQVTLLPKVILRTEQAHLTGPRGILNNKKEQGLAWEKPASLQVISDKPIPKQPVGLRLHGGEPGRKKDIESYRVLARSRFGKATIDAQSLLGNPSQIDFKSLVLKYTYQVLGGDQIQYFNPFVHALALTIGEKIDAIMPRHALIDLTVNEQHKGLYLAMEHQSRRSVAHWLGHDDFLQYTYKSDNTPAATNQLLSVVGKVRAAKGEQALNTFLQFYDADNAINSILLAAYVGDDDYCQGFELLTSSNDMHDYTSINSDVDHAFFETKGNELSINVEKYGWYLIEPEPSMCLRQQLNSWVYLQSAKFRTMVKNRMEALLNGVLSAEQAPQLLAPYWAINEQELEGRYTDALQSLQQFMQQRPPILRKQLDALEQRRVNIDPDNCAQQQTC